MLPNSIGAALAFLALQATGRVPAMLNHTAGVDAVLSACRTAGLHLVITSRRFVELAKLDALAERAGRQTVEIVWLEDLRATLGLADKLYGLVAPRFAASRHRRLGIAASRSGRDPVHLGVGRRAQRGRAEPRQSARQPAPDRGAHRLQPGRPSAQPAADVPQLRADRRVSAAAAVRRAGCSSTRRRCITGSSPSWPTISARRSCSAPTPSSPAMRAPPTLMISTRCAMSSPGPSRCARRPAGLGRAVRQAHPRRLRRHRMLAGHRDQHADAFQGGHGRPPAAADRAPAGAGSRHRRGRPAVAARAEYHVRLSAGRRARSSCSRPRRAGTTPATSSHRRRRVCDDRRPRQALCQARRRDGVAAAVERIAAPLAGLAARRRRAAGPRAASGWCW